MADPLIYREVTGLWTARIPDGPDTDAYPDTVPLAGRVVFTPNYRKPLVYPGEHVIVEQINAVLVDGVLMAESLDGENMTLGPLFLPVTVDERADQTWAWEMSFHALRLGEYGETVELRPVRFQVPEGSGPLDLSTVVPVSSSDGVITVRGPAGPGLTDITAVGDRVTFEWDDGRSRSMTVPTVPGVGVPSGGTPGQVVIRTATGTEWGPALPDTGSRHTHTLIQGWTNIGTGGNRARRMGPFVSLNFQLRRPATPGDGWFSMWSLPVGFRPSATFSEHLVAATEASPLATLYLDSSGEIRAYRSRETAAWGFVNITFLTDDPWPTVLPGTPA